ncbi:TPA: lipoyl synthase [archaeon]|uniref:Lipoyl synthase n=1 Tax=Candidatus Naiadarchaeum limnaeum TaxID=2756139 RepID=A0A832VAW9_9ARCH|nr:lipoyl synthase [Candidatus Naiadarchaeales archaeon SRR2090153.bin1042]HIK00766.1 lipoyl synthase [Candidatus Naiadarchaeum limnaeum]
MISNLGKPQWLKIRPPNTESFNSIKDTIAKLKLHTVCQEAHCPNMSECWSGGTATFMVMGGTCTRGCRFCSVESAAKGETLDPIEPKKLAYAVKEFGLDYVVITSVDRDDLSDQGAGHFAKCIETLRELVPNVLVEVLTPDFRGDFDCIKTVIDAQPTVFAHNIETVKRLQKYARDPRANYEQSLKVLKTAKELNSEIFTKSSIIVGFGEKEEEVIETMKDLRAVGVDILTIGQYLRPSDWHLPVSEYVSLEKFKFYEQKGLELGFKYVASGPFVRSSYKAGELFVKNLVKRNESE